jgi:phosphoribosylglycinamide formyltransferase-1
MDEGPIVAQAAVPVLPGDTPEILADRVLAAEHKLYPLALRLVASGRTRIVDERVVIEGESGEAQPPLFMPAV